MHQTKSFSKVEWKADSEGAFRAVIGTFDVVDKDGDVTLKGAFPEGKDIVVSAYGHSSWTGALPVGRGVVGSDTKSAWVDGLFFNDTTVGRDTYLTVKGLAAAGLGEWSYAYDPVDFSTAKDDLSVYPGAVRILKSMDVYEASPVLRGAGEGTGTEYVKATRPGKRTLLAALKAQAVDPALLAKIAQVDLLIDQADELMDTVMDDLGIPDPDETPADELDDTKKSLTLPAESLKTLVAVKGYATRELALAAMRTKEGRAISTARRERIASAIAAFRQHASELEDLLAETDPAPGKAAALFLDFELRRSELRDLGVYI